MARLFVYGLHHMFPPEQSFCPESATFFIFIFMNMRTMGNGRTARNCHKISMNKGLLGRMGSGWRGGLAQGTRSRARSGPDPLFMRELSKGPDL